MTKKFTMNIKAKTISAISKNEQNIFKLIRMLCDYGAPPTVEEFQHIMDDRNWKRDNPLEQFLREKTVKKYPCLDNLPITSFMKNTMIELPKECKEILSIYELLPKKDIQFDILVTKFINEFNSWFKK